MQPFYHDLTEEQVKHLAETLASLPDKKQEDAVFVLEYLDGAAKLFTEGNLTFEQFKEIVELTMKSITKLSGISIHITIVDNRN